MQTHIADALKDTPAGREAEAILRACVHCGFCNATCPTYQLLGDELDGPRGRIYLIKQLFEGAAVSHHTQQHLDRCLTCRNCETTCPSGVRYGRLVDLGRALTEARVERPRMERLKRRLIHAVLPHTRRFAAALAAGRALRGFLPSHLARKLPVTASPVPAWPEARHARRMLVLDGCVQPALAPEINAVAARVLDRLGVSLVRAEGAGCCGALSQHMAEAEAARAFMRRNIDAWWPDIEAGAEAIVITASGCGLQVKDYGYQLADDPAYAEKAARVSALARDLGEVVCDLIEAGDIAALKGRPRRVAYHPPCTLQHGQRLPGLVEGILQRLGHELVPVRDAHLCCGSAGSYSLLQPEISQRLGEAKLAHLTEAGPELIVSANIGCQSHLAALGGVPVRHWIELLDMDRG